MKSGQIIIENFSSQILKNNPLGDSSFRNIPVYLPPGYHSSNQKFPVVFLLSGFSSRGIMFLNQEPFSESFSQKLDRWIISKKIKPMIIVMPDCFTYYGGS